jgi:transposase-like protein
MATRRSLRSYTPEFVDRAVRMALEAQHGTGPSRRSMRSVSIELGIPWSSLYRWVREVHPERLGRFRPATRATTMPVTKVVGLVGDRESCRDVSDDVIRQDNVRLARENAILKAALSLLARDSALTTPL